MTNGLFDFKIIAASDPAPDPDLVRGHGRKGLGILISANEGAPEQLKLLENILTAIQYRLEDDAFLIRLPEHVRIQTGPISRQRQIRQWLLFGISPERASLHFPLSANIPMQHGGIIYLLAPSLETLNQERLQEKRPHGAALWAALKAIFPKP
ncbi:MAG: hypothetical protein IPH16_22335 [Haliscomenobacter sp.]|nr:hypothetical protein [Haliscomenobacter sp.]MBK8879133.1 hypothetical protein [Haliscomenobacter sp.]